MSESENESMETTRMYRDDLELSRLSLHLSSRDLINDTPQHKYLSKPDVTFDSLPGEASVDFVLVTSTKAKTPVDTNGWNRRSAFEERMKEQGLLLEEDVIGGLTFVKVHAPVPVLRRYCEILKLRMPMNECTFHENIPQTGFDLFDTIKSMIGKFVRLFVTIDPGSLTPSKYILTAEYSRDKSYLFNEDDPSFFSAEVRTLVIDFILNRISWGKDQGDVNCVGIQCLLDEGIYKAAYPLHDGEHTTENSLRHELYVEWALLSKWIRRQPIDQIKEYLGVKYAFYFTWLGFYTHLLIPAAFMGLIVFFYGVFTLPYDKFSSDICNSTDTIMCPLCDRTCDYWELSNTCFYARLTHLFDNNLTFFFSFLMSIWATLFLELWKRYSATITHRWGLTGFTLEAEHPRPQYLARLSGSKHSKINVVTGNIEPTVPWWKKIPATVFSFSVLLLLIMIAIASVFGVVLYRMSVLTSLSLASQSDWMSHYSNIIVPTTAAIINLVCIQLLNFVYDKVAMYLTEMELLRTQTEFDESLSTKIYLFQFVNYYTSIIYIAFVKGKNTGYPAKYLRIFGLRQEECSPGGCLMELSIQLFIIMVGQQAVNTIVEMIIPAGLNWFNSRTENTGRLDAIKSSSEEKDLELSNKKPWTEDYKLLDWGPRGLFPEYLEMVMQYGFVTLFVCAFPLGPFFALLNNVLEMRLDAKKFLRYYRKPIPHRVPNIGIWYRVLDIIGKLAVITNGFIIAFSSNFVPRIVYLLLHSENGTDEGFLNSTLAYFYTEDFEKGVTPLNTSYNVTYCRYKDYRNPPWSPNKYERPTYYYEVLVARLTFVVIFQNIVSLVKVVVQWLIPDVPNALSDRIKRESYLTTQMIIKHEAKKAAEVEHYSGMMHDVNSPQSL
ncbi:anoctamin-1 [Daktulosphaira vitifoliae]|uniref:anoctamin-1 n=1 Tax=Daktulosphaira vitifoliae TaxID=58002 RepID=UPI0021AAC117|nr:anoctamin-1 [Daktulosphaira vitifoliae]XP_050545541.1 anoctamin-1 [Daktulosphaira vitifoliae]XP_050545542.1 anoctamin-1 [Daktulosphaira vitifoliae]XP_050545543.1 anoctamin-1 [Daktulosphaira vitifoliae]XP_050545544.1 anoctamin-1 [Daktulosphaira vitifoliae]XP_050545545.1 anoctamin-1 [Daktulosphaira vitifoliae]XP_050545546.1 anoctamin-1 [Daktulosphaira vitifoliae]XP_050545547.1 anoctamin-1 [Daktulosphaira vitifoliae]XP_050545549.1 anoctamin-1 [Daktulosphaira vitifoliae]XP_050545550.1 anoct